MTTHLESSHAGDGAFAKLQSAIKVIGGAGQALELRLGRDGAAHQALERYAALPNLSNPRALVPMDASAAAWRAVLAGHAAGAANPLMRAAATLLRLASPQALRAFLEPTQISVSAGAAGLSQTPLHAFLAGALGRGDFVTGLRLAPGRPNGKPVVQVVAQDGAVLAYAKFGWDDLTARLIRREAAALSALNPLTRGMPLKLPAVLHSGAWRGMETLVLSPLAHGRTPRGSGDVPVAASVALAGLESRQVQPLGDSGFWSETTRDMQRFGALLGGRAEQAFARAQAAIEARWGADAFAMGWSHGDWIPANLSIRADGAFSVWDWERGQRGVPLGVDMMQFILSVEMRRHGSTPALATRVERYARPALARHGLDPAAWSVLVLLSLIRSALWYGEAREAGRAPQEGQRFIEAIELFTARAGAQP